MLIAIGILCCHHFVAVIGRTISTGTAGCVASSHIHTSYQMRRLASCSTLALALACCVAPAFAAETAVGKKIDGFSLHDFRGKVHTLSDMEDNKGVVVAFLGVDCPLARLYAPRLEEMAAEFAEKGVALVAIDSNRQDSVTDLAGFAQRYKLTFPVLKDPNNKVADQFGAQRTPEVFLLDSAGVVRYHGRIDDQYGQHLAENNKRISFQHTSARSPDLVNAIDEMVSGKEITVASTEVTGCLIGRVPSVEPTGEVLTAIRSFVS